MSESSIKPSQRRRYPSLSLEQAIERAQVLYNAERLNAAPIAVITDHWGFSSPKTGPASTTYSAVKQFGLIEETGAPGQRKARISQRGRAILTAPDHVRRDEIRAAALEPAMNRLIWDQHGADPGSDGSFRWALVEMGFSDTGAKEFAKQYRATIAFAGLEDDQPPSVSDVPASDAGNGDEDAWDEPEPSLQRTPGARAAAPSARATAARPAPTARPGAHVIPLLGGKQVVLDGDFPLSEAAWDQFMLILKAFKPGLTEPDQRPAPPQAAEPAPGAADGDDDWGPEG